MESIFHNASQFINPVSLFNFSPVKDLKEESKFINISVNNSNVIVYFNLLTTKFFFDRNGLSE